MKTIKFFKNWNNKLDCDYFTTIRLYTDKKADYYFDNLDKEFAVLLNNKLYCKATLISMQDNTLEQLTAYNDFLLRLDAGLTGGQFYKLMEIMYHKKEEWDNDKTFFLLLLFKRLK